MHLRRNSIILIIVNFLHINKFSTKKKSVSTYVDLKMYKFIKYIKLQSDKFFLDIICLQNLTENESNLYNNE